MTRAKKRLTLIGFFACYVVMIFSVYANSMMGINFDFDFTVAEMLPIIRKWGPYMIMGFMPVGLMFYLNEKHHKDA